MSPALRNTARTIVGIVIGFALATAVEHLGGQVDELPWNLSDDGAAWAVLGCGAQTVYVTTTNARTWHEGAMRTRERGNIAWTGQETRTWLDGEEAAIRWEQIGYAPLLRTRQVGEICRAQTLTLESARARVSGTFPIERCKAARTEERRSCSGASVLMRRTDW